MRLSKKRNLLRLLTLCGLFCASLVTHFAFGEEDIPKPFPESRYEHLWEHNPFTQGDLDDDTTGTEPRGGLQLAGIINAEGNLYAIVVDKDMNKRMLVTEKVNLEGYRLKSITIDPDPSKTIVVIEKGLKTIALRYSAEYIEALKKEELEL